MSRVGNAKITIPEGVDVSFNNNIITVKGSKGELTQEIDSCVTVTIEDSEISFSRESDAPQHRSKHGLYRALVNNMVIGVSQGYKKELEVIGVGYRANARGQQLDLSLGYSHNIILEFPKEIKVTTVSEKGKAPIVTLESIDKQLVGQAAAKVRSLRKPEPYKGKGIKYVGEELRRKAGKTAAAK
ncbi:MAG: 50S ribosomal protein L6 [Crocinitomicaceae bacterium]|nr:50S ribosomal protein L6 [Crocinitomicaceae bacterium]